MSTERVTPASSDEDDASKVFESSRQPVADRRPHRESGESPTFCSPFEGELDPTVFGPTFFGPVVGDGPAFSERLG